MRRFYFVIFLIIFSNLGCALFENFDELPMFIEVNSVGLNTSTAQGSASHNIIDIWPNAEGQSLGVFEMPITFQVLDDNETTNMIYFAGIRRAGFPNDHTIYPFYERIQFDRDFVPDSRVVEDLVFRYKENTQFRVIEDFELNHSFTEDIDENEETTIVRTTDGGMEGNCALITLTEENNEFVVGTSDEIIDLPTNGTAVYMELDYKTDVNLGIGLQADVNGSEIEQFLLVLTPNETWNKVYIDFSELLQDSALPAYRLILGARYEGDSTAEVRFDNIKLMHF